MKLEKMWFLSVFILLLACNESKKASNEKPLDKSNSKEAESTRVAPELEGIYILQKFNKETIKNTTSYKSPTIEIELSEGKVRGNGGCNKYSGNIGFLEEKQIKIDQVSTTEVACPQSDLEGRYLQAITGGILTYKMNGNEVIFYNDKTTMVFEKAK